MERARKAERKVERKGRWGEGGRVGIVLRKGSGEVGGGVGGEGFFWMRVEGLEGFGRC